MGQLTYPAGSVLGDHKFFFSEAIWRVGQHIVQALGGSLCLEQEWTNGFVWSLYTLKKKKGIFLSHEKFIFLVLISSQTSVLADEQRESIDVSPFCFLERKNKGTLVVDSLEVYT